MKSFARQWGQGRLLSGFSLVELLVASLLGVVLSGTMVASYLGARRQVVYEDQLARMQEMAALH